MRNGLKGNPKVLSHHIPTHLQLNQQRKMGLRQISPYLKLILENGEGVEEPKQKWSFGARRVVDFPCFDGDESRGLDLG